MPAAAYIYAYCLDLCPHMAARIAARREFSAFSQVTGKQLNTVLNKAINF
jgi:hypothetical protein